MSQFKTWKRPYQISFSILAAGVLSACSPQLAENSRNRSVAARDPGAQLATAAPAIASLSLIDMKSGQVIAATMSNGGKYTVDTLTGRCLSVRAAVNSSASSVGFGYDGNSKFATENGSPYDLMGDNGYRGCITAAQHTVTAIPYASDNRGGSVGSTVTYAFTVAVAASPSPSPTATPQPSAPPQPSPSPSATPTPVPQGKSYHFSTTIGDDTRTATQAQNPSTPWRSVTKLNWLLSKDNPLLLPGDSVLLKRGDVFEGSLQVQRSGDPGKPITIGAYGTGDRPVITLFETLGNWQSLGNGIWEAACKKCGASISSLSLDRETRAMGRWPNPNAANGGYRTVKSHVGNTSLTDIEAIPSSPSWIGATAVIRAERWVLDRLRISGQTSTTLTFDASSRDTPKDGFGYFIQNHPATLDQDGEWYYNPSTHKVRMIFGSAIPAAHPVEVSTGQNAIHIYNQDDLRILDLAVRGANENGVYLYSAARISILNLDVFGNGIAGINFSILDDSLLEGNIARSNNSWGINGEGATNGNTFRRNRIENNGMLAEMGGDGAHTYTGLRINGNDNLVEYNQIRVNGYNGVRFNGNRNTFSKNLIERYSLVKDDSAGIYTGNPTGDTDREGNVLANNIILDGIGAPLGTGRSGGSTSGIYVDDNGSGVSILNNTIAGMPLAGIFIHNAHNLTISGNTILDTPTQLYMKHDNTDWPTIYGVQVQKNLFFDRKGGQRFVFQTSIKDDIGTFTTLMDYNRYATPWDDGYGIDYELKASGRTGSTNLGLWRPLFGKDTNSAHMSKRIDPYAISAVGGERVPNGKFATSKSGAGGSDLTWVSSGLDTGTVKWVPSTGSSNASFSIGAVTAGRVYRLRFSIKGTSDSNIGVSAYLRTAGSPYDKLTPVITRTVKSVRQDLEIEFQATQSSSSSTLFLNLAAASGRTFYLDNVSLVEATSVTVTPVNQLVRLHYNAEPSSKTISLDGNWVDSYGKAYSGSFTLEPYTSVILIRN